MVGKLIEARMRELGLSQAAVAKRSGLTRQYVGLLVNGKRGERIGAKAASALATALGVDSSFFFSLEATQVDKSSRKVGRS